MRPTAALAIAASVLGAAGGTASAEGPCGTPLLSGDTTRIGNQVFLDADDNGLFDSGDTELAGVNVGLWLDVDGDGTFEPGADDGNALCSTTTDAQGQYWFTEVASGSYFVAVTGGVPSGHVSSTSTTADPAIDNNDNGAAAAGLLSVSGPISVSSDDNQPTGEAAPGAATGADEAAANAANDHVADANSNLTFDFGFAPVDDVDGTTGTPTCVSIGNRVWHDANGDGIDNDEAGISGVTVELFAADANGNPIGTAVDSMTTSDGGYYQFTCVDPGSYVVVIPGSNLVPGGALDGMQSTVDRGDAAANDLTDDGINPADAAGDIVSQPVDLITGDAPTGETDKPAGEGLDFDAPADENSNTTVDFGFTEAPSAQIGDKVWSDTNGNGVQDDGEAGVANVKVNLLDADGTFLEQTMTNANGMYLFDELAPGTYTVCFDTDSLPEGMVVTQANAADDDAADSDAGPAGCTPAVTLEDGDSDMTIDLGIVDAPVELASIGDKVWIDANSNGIQDEGEDAVADVTVQLRHEDGTILDTTVTDANGMYIFDQLEPGDYQVCFNMDTLPDGMIETDINQGDADDADSDAGADGCTPLTTLDPGENDSTIDLGIRLANADLGITKTGAVDVDNQIWTITVTNNGSDRHPGSIVVTDTLPAGLDLVAGSGGEFDCNAAGQTVTCIRDAELAAGESAVLLVTTTTNDAAGCDVTNAVTVSSAANDEVVANDSASADLKIDCASPLVLTTTPTPTVITTTTPTQTSLPVTGSNVGPMLVSALLLAGIGWRLVIHVQRERPVSIDEMLG